MSDETTRFHVPMVCVHSDDGKHDAQTLMDDVYQRLGCDASDFLTAVVVSLNWEYRCGIESIANDMWSGVHIESGEYLDRDHNEPYDPKRRYQPIASVYVECDLVEHGVAAAWQFIADLHDYAGTKPEEQ